MTGQPDLLPILVCCSGSLRGHAGRQRLCVLLVALPLAVLVTRDRRTPHACEPMVLTVRPGGDAALRTILKTNVSPQGS